MPHIEFLRLLYLHKVFPKAANQRQGAQTGLCLSGLLFNFRLLAINDEWFSDDLKRMDDDNVYRKMQGHWIIEMSEMMATVNAKSIEDIKSLDKELKELATKHNEDINKVREIAETYNEMNHFDDEEGEIQSQLENIESSNELKQIIQQLVNERLQA